MIIILDGSFSGGIQEYIARDADSIGRVEDEDLGQYILVSPSRPSNSIYIFGE